MKIGEFRLSGSILEAELVVPKQIHAEDGTLFWRVKPNKWCRSSEGILEDFIAAGHNPDTVLQFARRYGPLHLCAHGWANHSSTCSEQPAPPESGWHYQEPIERWGALARSAAALMKAAENISIGKVPPDHILDSIDPGWPLSLAFRAAKKSESGKRISAVNLTACLVEKCLHDWVVGSGLRPQVEWCGTWRFFLGVDASRTTPMSAIAARLLFAITGAQALVTCSACGHPYMPERRPREGSSYCGACQTNGEKWKHQKRNQRKKLAAQSGPL